MRREIVIAILLIILLGAGVFAYQRLNQSQRELRTILSPTKQREAVVIRTRPGLHGRYPDDSIQIRELPTGRVVSHVFIPGIIEDVHWSSGGDKIVVESLFRSLRVYDVENSEPVDLDCNLYSRSEWMRFIRREGDSLLFGVERLGSATEYIYRLHPDGTLERDRMVIY